jgi:hypothetical protein
MSLIQTTRAPPKNEKPLPLGDALQFVKLCVSGLFLVEDVLSWIQYTASHHVSLSPIFILLFHLCKCAPHTSVHFWPLQHLESLVRNAHWIVPCTQHPSPSETDTRRSHAEPSVQLWHQHSPTQIANACLYDRDSQPVCRERRNS